MSTFSLLYASSFLYLSSSRFYLSNCEVFICCPDTHHEIQRSLGPIITRSSLACEPYAQMQGQISITASLLRLSHMMLRWLITFCWCCTTPSSLSPWLLSGGISSDISRYTMSKQGFAIRRNGTCLSSETSCGITWDTWDPCCPGNTECADVNSNTQCNPASMAGPAFSQCSNPEWDLYQANGFFCCESGQTAFTSTGSDTKGFYGCAEKDTFDNKVMRSLSPVQTATSK